MSEEITDEWIIEEILGELKEARAIGRNPTFFGGGREEIKRIKKLFPIASILFGRWNA